MNVNVNNQDINRKTINTWCPPDLTVSPILIVIRECTEGFLIAGHIVSAGELPSGVTELTLLGHSFRP